MKRRAWISLLLLLASSLMAFVVLGCKTTSKEAHTDLGEPTEYIAKLTSFSPHYFSGRYITESEAIVFVEYFGNNSRKIRKTKPLSHQEVNAALQQISTLGVDKWNPDYGAHEFFSNSGSESNLPASPPFSWDFHRKSFEDFPEKRSGGRGLFPSDQNANIPFGPDPTDAYRSLAKIFLETCPDPWIE
jgi:hypothetical protein